MTTQIYADVAQETIRSEYFQALDKVSTRYTFPAAKAKFTETSGPHQTISDVIRWLHNTGTNDKKSKLLIKRLHRLKSEMEDLTDAI